jgi:microcin C transport system permease protein
MLVNFCIIQAAPGGPVEQFLAKLNHATKVSGEAENINAMHNFSIDEGLKYRGAEGVDQEIIKKIEKLYGFDLPLWQRFWLMIKKFLVFDFGVSFYQDKKVVDLVLEKLSTSMSLGLTSTLLIYFISIPLGIKKATKSGSRFDLWTSSAIIIGYAVPAFLFAILLIIFFAGGNFWHIFPLRGLISENFHELNWLQKIADYFWRHNYSGFLNKLNI